MVFAIPDWEDGSVKKTTVFSERTKGKQKNGSPNKPPQNKTNPKNAAKVNSVSEKSKLINKENKKQLRKQKQRSNHKTENNNNNQPKVKILNTAKPKNVFSKNHEIQKENSKMTKQENKTKSRNLKKDNSDSSLKVENLDTDKLDEVLLNAKKKKFNEALKKDDVEDVLFKEDKVLETINKKPQTNERVQLNSPTASGVKNKSKAINKKQSFIERKQKELKNISLVKAKNKNTSLNKCVVDKEVLKVNLEENNKQRVETRLDKKKNKLRMILKEESNRNPINFNRNKLRERMLDRLKSAQFRFLNEKLYTSSGSEARQLFQNDPTAFQNYHEGYQQQLKKWPVNPLEVIIKRIKKMSKSSLIADMGCGEAALSKRIPHSVRSFDLVGAAPGAGVEVCDMAHTPLLAASMDVVVYCLALMGTELTAYLLEANRVLKMGGHLLIAEVESRFTDVNAFTKEVTRLGFKLHKLNSEHEVFFFMEFVKNQEPPVKKAKLPVLKLKPCIYKRR